MTVQSFRLNCTSAIQKSLSKRVDNSEKIRDSQLLLLFLTAGGQCAATEQLTAAAALDTRWCPVARLQQHIPEAALRGGAEGQLPLEEQSHLTTDTILLVG